MKKILIIILLILTKAEASSEKPNVIVIYSDDQAQEDIGSFGGKIGADTANLDKLAASGVKFNNFYSAAPICSPSRAALLTGKTPSHAGFNSNASKKAKGLPLANKTMADYFKAAGYETHLIGKWHLGETPDFHPLSRGFDSFFGHLSGCIDNITHLFRWNGTHKDTWLNREPLDVEGTHLAELLMNRAKRVIFSAEKPFFLYYAINQPHYPIQPLEKFVEKYELASSKDGNAHYRAFVETVDHMVGELIEDLTISGKLKNTIIIFQSDHGHSAEARNWDQIDGLKQASNIKFRTKHPYTYSGAKFSLLEGGIKVPAIISWQKKLPANTSRDHLAVSIDWLPTLANLVGFKVDRRIDGKSLIPMIYEDEKIRNQYFWKHFKKGWALREGKWKLIKHAFNPNSDKKYDIFSLYDVESDKKESKNLRFNEEKVFRRLLKKARAFDKDAKPIY